MVMSEDYKTRADGVKLIRTYSTAGLQLLRNDGVVFDEAVDVEGAGYTYTETGEAAEITAEEALSIITGGDS